MFQSKALERSVSTILGELSPEELERVTIDIIRENKLRVDHAQALYERLENFDGSQEDEKQLRHDYRIALLLVKSHHFLVATVIGKLGFVPNVPDGHTLQ